MDSIYPYFIEHARRVYPHLECEKELKTLSDLTQPHNWYPKAREVFRKIHFHAGSHLLILLEFFKRRGMVLYNLVVFKNGVVIKRALSDLFRTN